MRRILFVDDEPAVLGGLQNLLHRQRRRWDMVFAQGGEAALAELATRPFDVIVTDMRMPGIDGAELLRRVKADHPEVVRVILSGHAERDAVFRALPVAHEFLSKPCDPELLPNVIERVCELQAAVGNQTLSRVIGGIDRLPSAPRSYFRINQAIADDKSSLPEIAAILQEDTAVCAKLLQLVNSVYFGLKSPVSDVQRAVAFLGLDTVRSLVLSAHILRSFEQAPKIPGFSAERLQAYTLITAKVARRITRTRPDAHAIAQECFTAGLLHDIGKLVIATSFPDAFAAFVAARAAGEITSSCAWEREHLGFTHAEVGAYLLRLWALPTAIVEAVAFHHEPGRVPQRGFEIVGCVHVADALVDGCLPDAPCWQGVTRTEGEADLGYLEALGVSDQLPAWRAIAEEEARAFDQRLN